MFFDPSKKFRPNTFLAAKMTIFVNDGLSVFHRIMTHGTMCSVVSGDAFPTGNKRKILIVKSDAPGSSANAFRDGFHIHEALLLLGCFLDSHDQKEFRIVPQVTAQH